MLAQAETIRRLIFAAPVSLAILAALAAVSVVLLVALYRTERRLVTWRQGITLTVLRSILCLLVLLMLAEPIISTTYTELRKQSLVVLVDESTSMDIADAHISAGRKLRLADGLDMVAPTARPVRLEPAEAALRRAASLAQASKAYLEMLGERRAQSGATDATPTPPAKGTSHRRLAVDLERIAAALDLALNDLAATLQQEAVAPGERRTLGEMAGRLDTRVTATVRGLIEKIGDAEWAGRGAPKEMERIARALEEAIAVVGTSADQLAAIGRTLDDAFADRADAPTRAAMNEAARLRRRRIAARWLNPQDGPLPGNLDDIDLRAYSFASDAREVPFARVVGGPSEQEQGAETQPGDAPATTAATGDVAWRNRTDLAGALEAAMRGLGEAPPAGILLVTDGRHNIDTDVVAVAERLGASDAPIFPLIIGTANPPTDAAVLAVDAPNTVYLEDAVEITASLKLDGLAGKPATVRLLDAAGKVLDEETVTAAGPRERREITLTHTPGEKGRTAYQLDIVPIEGEVLDDNNRRKLAVDVNDERTKVLIVDGRSRWEFRYLRNMLLRDKSIKLQSVLFAPPYIEKEPPRPPITAKASNRDAEADRLPDTAENLNAFDVIVLGDVDSADLSTDDQHRIEQFVADRGGCVVVIAGPEHMPADYHGQPLASVIPVVAESADPTSEGIFQLGLTAEGRADALARLHLDADENARLWKHLPIMHWRSTWRKAKGSATVLVFADAVTKIGSSPTTAPASQPDGRRRDAERERANAMMCAQTYGLGKVLYLGWDATWRLRHKVGDKLHHKLWRQVFRWATDGNLATGLELVKLGTDQARYAQDEPVTVRAKFSRPDLTPMPDALASTEIRTGDKVVRSGRLHYVSGSPGMYEAKFTDLPRGELTVALKSPQIDELRQPDDPPGEVSTRIVIDAAESPESLNLAANESLLQRLADVSGGVRVTPADPRPFRAALDTEPARNVRETQMTLWNSWWLLSAMVVVITVEWILRKRAGLI